MNILISISHFKIGGAQTFVVRLAKALAKNHSVYIYNYESHREFHKYYLEDTVLNQVSPDIKVIYLPVFLDLLAIKVNKVISIFGLKPNVWKFLKSLHLKAIIYFYKIDIINSHLIHSDSFLVKTIQDSKIPMIITDHGDYRFAVEENLSTWDEVINIFNRVDAIVHIANCNAKNISKYTANSKVIQKKIYNGVFPTSKNSYSESAKEKLGIPKNSFVFGMVARGIPEKGWVEAIQAFQLVQTLSEKEVHLIFVGDSDYLSSLKQSLEPKLISVVHFTGYSSEPNYWIESFNVGLLPSYFPGESLPNSIIEYLCLGKPVIATEVGGIPEMLNHNGQTPGFIISLSQAGKADVPTMVDAMLNYINDSDLLEKHSFLARQASEKFKMQTCVEAYEILFQQVLSKIS